MDHPQLLATAKPIVWRRGYQAGFSSEDREDLLQDVLMKYLHAWPAGSAPGNLEAWFETTTANAIVDRLREVGRRPANSYAEGGEDPVSLAIAAMGSTRFASAPAVSENLLHAVFSLIPEPDAHLLRRRYLRNCTAAEIAEELRISVANVDQRTTRAKRKLRDALAGRPDLVAELRRPHPHIY